MTHILIFLLYFYISVSLCSLNILESSLPIRIAYSFFNLVCGSVGIFALLYNYVSCKFMSSTYILFIGFAAIISIGLGLLVSLSYYEEEA